MGSLSLRTVQTSRNMVRAAPPARRTVQTSPSMVRAPAPIRTVQTSAAMVRATPPARRTVQTSPSMVRAVPLPPAPSSRTRTRDERDEPNRSGTRAEAAALALSESSTAPTEVLRMVAQSAGAAPGVVQGSRKVLVQALGAEAVARAGAEPLSNVVGRMRAKGFSNGEIGAAGLYYPDPNLLRQPGGHYGLAVRRYDQVPIYALMGLDLASAENGSGSASAPPFSGMPGAVPYRAGNWSEDFSEYTIAEGDTFCGLGKTYGKGLCAKGVEIFSYQPDKFSHCMDPASCTPGRKMYAPGDVLQMPPWAQEQARAYAAADVPSAPSTPGAPGYGNQAPGKPDKPGSKPKPGGGASPSGIWEKHKVPILIGTAVALGGAIVAFG